VFLPPVIEVESAGPLCLLQYHQPSVEALDRRMAITDALRDLVKRLTKIIVNPSDVLRLCIRLPRLRAIDMLETDVVPNVLPRRQDDRQQTQSLSPLLRDLWEILGAYQLSESIVQ